MDLTLFESSEDNERYERETVDELVKLLKRIYPGAVNRELSDGDLRDVGENEEKMFFRKLRRYLVLEN